MIYPSPEASPEQLPQLLVDYSYPEKRYPGILEDINRLLQSALEHHIHPGATPDTVQQVLGEPYGIVGDDRSTSWDWLYPCLASQKEAARSPVWFIVLRFRQGVLQSIDRQSWIE